MAETKTTYHVQEEEYEPPRLSEPPSAQPSPSNSILRERQYANLPPRPPKPPQTPKVVGSNASNSTNNGIRASVENGKALDKKQNLLTLLPPSEKAKVGQLIKQLVKEKTEKENVKQELSALTSKFEGKVATLRENNVKMKEETDCLKKKFSQSLGMIQAYQNELLLRDQSERSMHASESEASPNPRRRSGSVSSSYASHGARAKTRGKVSNGARIRNRSWAGRGSGNNHHVNSSHADAEENEDTSIEVVDSSCQVDVDEPPALVSIARSKSTHTNSSPEHGEVPRARGAKRADVQHAEVQVRASIDMVEADAKNSAGVTNNGKSSENNGSKESGDTEKVETGSKDEHEEKSVGIEQVAEALTQEQFALLQKYMKLRGQELKVPAKPSTDRSAQVETQRDEEIEEPKSEPVEEKFGTKFSGT